MQRKIHAIYITYIALYFALFVTPEIQAPFREYGMLVIAILPAFLIAANNLLYSRFWKAMAAAHLVWACRDECGFRFPTNLPLIMKPVDMEKLREVLEQTLVS